MEEITGTNPDYYAIFCTIRQSYSVYRREDGLCMARKLFSRSACNNWLNK